jgi:hypothetical protein
MPPTTKQLDACWAGNYAKQQPHTHAVGDVAHDDVSVTDTRGHISTPFSSSHGTGGHSLHALAAMESWGGSGALAPYGPAPIPLAIRGGRRTTIVNTHHRVVGNHGKPLVIDMRTMAPSYMWSHIPRHLADARPLP